MSKKRQDHQAPPLALPAPLLTTPPPQPPPPPPQLPGSDGWGAWGNHVLKELDRGHSEREKLAQMVTDHNATSVGERNALRIEIATLKGSSVRWGALSGVLTSLTAFVALVASWFGLGGGAPGP